ncbi:MAG: tripartite tricarboxylate transporter substrate binding protein [Variibacter sp.]|nr:tripartite tricarboxylate transporter substrate binding protein [Variibacter sp.]
MRAVLVAAAFAVQMAVGAGVAQAASYPTRLVKIIVGFPAGSSIDILTRIYAQKLSDRFKQQFIVESRPGAASNIAAESVVHAEPDGYTLYVGTVSNTVGTSLLKNLKFNFAEDLAPISQIAVTSMVLVVQPKLGIATVSEFVAHAKARPGQVFYASSGVGSAPHMAGELFNLMTKAGIMHVPYKAIPPALVDMLGGRIDSVFATTPTAAPYINDGRVKALAVTTARRAKVTPNVPTMAEAGLAGYDSGVWFGFFAPKKTPEPILQELETALAQINTQPEVIALLADTGNEPFTMPRQQFGEFVRAETAKWRDVVSFSKMSVD